MLFPFQGKEHTKISHTLEGVWNFSWLLLSLREIEVKNFITSCKGGNKIENSLLLEEYRIFWISYGWSRKKSHPLSLWERGWKIFYLLPSEREVNKIFCTAEAVLARKSWSTFTDQDFLAINNDFCFHSLSLKAERMEAEIVIKTSQLIRQTSSVSFVLSTGRSGKWEAPLTFPPIKSCLNRLGAFSSASVDTSDDGW